MVFWRPPLLLFRLRRPGQLQFEVICVKIHNSRFTIRSTAVRPTSYLTFLDKFNTAWWFVSQLVLSVECCLSDFPFVRSFRRIWLILNWPTVACRPTEALSCFRKRGRSGRVKMLFFYKRSFIFDAVLQKCAVFYLFYLFNCQPLSAIDIFNCPWQSFTFVTTLRIN